MSYREKLIEYIQTNVDPEFDADEQALTQVLDSVSLLQLITYIDQELGIPVDMSSLTLDMFASVDTLLEALQAYAAE
jgi:acyl carrier protein